MNSKEQQKAYDDWEERCLIRHGFLIHHVINPDNEGTQGIPILDSHTHGVLEKWDHPEIQLIFPPGMLADGCEGALIHAVVDQIREGTKFQEGGEYEKILKGKFRATFIKAGENLRLILPDPEGNLHSTNPPYAIQRSAKIL